MVLNQSILATLAYHDIFNYPLTIEEIHRYLINQKTSPRLVERSLIDLVKLNKIGKSQNYFFLKGRRSIVQVRLARRRFSKNKFKKAQTFAGLLKIIPTLKLVAISGALSMENSHRHDDIDLVLITAQDALWTTRFLANLILLPFKRTPASPKVTDRACLNLFIDSSTLKIRSQNLYTAHEICQMKVLWDRGATYSRFIKVNQWVTKFLPNWQPIQTGSKKSRKFSIFNLPRWQAGFQFSILEAFLKKFQLAYMRAKITTEKIGDRQLFFHPADTQNRVLTQYRQFLQKLSLNPQKFL